MAEHLEAGDIGLHKHPVIAGERRICRPVEPGGEVHENGVEQDSIIAGAIGGKSVETVFEDHASPVG
jgi:hypothetical protein